MQFHNERVRTMTATIPKKTKAETAQVIELIEKKLTPEAKQALEAMRRVGRRKGYFAVVQMPRLHYVSCDQDED